MPSALLIFTLNALCPILSLAGGFGIEVERKLVTIEPLMGIASQSVQGVVPVLTQIAVYSPALCDFGPKQQTPENVPIYYIIRKLAYYSV